VWRRLSNKVLCDLYFSHKYDLGDQIERMRWVGHVAGGGEVHTGFGCGDLRERDHLEDLDIHGRIILLQIFKKWLGETWTGLIYCRIETGGWALVNAEMNLRVSESAGNFLTCRGITSFSGRTLLHGLS
jgi:hypothetical protein